MVNSNGELTTSIPSQCPSYRPDRTKPTKVKCEKLGVLYECRNHKGKRKGCLFCEKYAGNKIPVPEFTEEQKSYVVLKLKMAFDVPQSSSKIDSRWDGFKMAVKVVRELPVRPESKVMVRKLSSYKRRLKAAEIERTALGEQEGSDVQTYRHLCGEIEILRDVVAAMEIVINKKKKI
jgi:hypothetical protein